MKTRLYLDTRHAEGDRPAPLYYAVARHGRTALIPLNVSVALSRWDATNRRLKQLPEAEWPGRKRLKAYIDGMVLRIDGIILDGEEAGDFHALDANGVREYILSRLRPSDTRQPSLLLPHLRAFADRHRPRTRELYLITAVRLAAYCADTGTDAERLTFEDITVPWLQSFDAFLARTSPSPNARGINLRNLRAVFNDAIDAELTTAYPFRRYRIKSVETAKRSLTAAQLRAFLAAPCPTPIVEGYRDIFELIFYLIGINVADLFALRHSDYYDGRIHYVRAKTGKAYSIKVEPEAAAILERHRGHRLLLDAGDNFARGVDYMHYLNKNLKRVGEYTDIAGNVCRPFAHVTTYWARHTWATLAVNALDTPKETVSAALGHELGSRITSIYIDFDQRKVDEANRRVIDYVRGL